MAEGKPAGCFARINGCLGRAVIIVFTLLGILFGPPIIGELLERVGIELSWIPRLLIGAVLGGLIGFWIGRDEATGEGDEDFFE